MWTSPPLRAVLGEGRRGDAVFHFQVGGDTAGHLAVGDADGHGPARVAYGAVLGGLGDVLAPLLEGLSELSDLVGPVGTGDVLRRRAMQQRVVAVEGVGAVVEVVIGGPVDDPGGLVEDFLGRAIAERQLRGPPRMLTPTVDRVTCRS